MNSYLLTLIVKPDVSDKDRQELLESVTKQFEKVTKEDLWGSKSLAYEIKHNAKGFYAHYEFEADPKVISSLDKNLKLNEDILRYLLLKK